MNGRAFDMDREARFALYELREETARKASFALFMVVLLTGACLAAILTFVFFGWEVMAIGMALHGGWLAQEAREAAELIDVRDRCDRLLASR